MEFGLALIEKEGNDGLTKSEAMDLFDMLNNVEAYPIEIFAQEHERTAMGFISASAAVFLNYEYYENSELHDFVAAILDDMNLESEGGIYEFRGVQIWLGRNIES